MANLAAVMHSEAVLAARAIDFTYQGPELSGSAFSNLLDYVLLGGRDQDGKAVTLRLRGVQLQGRRLAHALAYGGRRVDSPALTLSLEDCIIDATQARREAW